MNCMILDDDDLSRRILEEFINKTEGLVLKHSCSYPVQCINILKKDDSVDLIFLDIEMPEMSGIDFLDSLLTQPQVIIFSSKGKYAVDSYNYDVTDYLLKPVSYKRFLQAVDKVEKRTREASIDQSGGNEIFIKKNSTLVRLKYDEILWIEALENYVIFNTYKDKYTIHFTMKAIEQKLPPKKFTRVHRSYIVNTSRIEVIEDNSVIVKTEETSKSIPIGKSYKEKLMKDINLIIK
ncbi:MAG: LytTR family DNA-binding domain-containing protein [Bacteroidales bacterium]|nr:LytTR family DNA-binding domain-containing protein [Bacteroidales bacterium]MDT8432747.1 LytTR family DNA-binding domain-containing protein [Bacteroidales bacterium]